MILGGGLVTIVDEEEEHIFVDSLLRNSSKKVEDLQKISVNHFPGIQVGLPKVELLHTFLQNFTTSWLFRQNVQITTIRDLTQTDENKVIY